MGKPVAERMNVKGDTSEGLVELGGRGEPLGSVKIMQEHAIMWLCAINYYAEIYQRTGPV